MQTHLLLFSLLLVEWGPDYSLSTPPSIRDVLAGDECTFSIDPSTSK